MTRRLAPWISLLLVWSLLPMLWQLISSFSTAESLVDGSIPFLQRWTLVHYRELLASDPPFWSWKRLWPMRFHGQCPLSMPR